MKVNLTVNWTPNAAEEAVTGYDVLVDGAVVGSSAVPGFQGDVDVEPGQYALTVVPNNALGPGPASDPVQFVIPALCTKPVGVTVSIKLSVQVG